MPRGRMCVHPFPTRRTSRLSRARWATVRTRRRKRLAAGVQHAPAAVNVHGSLVSLSKPSSESGVDTHWQDVVERPLSPGPPRPGLLRVQHWQPHWHGLSRQLGLGGLYISTRILTQRP